MGRRRLAVALTSAAVLAGVLFAGVLVGHMLRGPAGDPARRLITAEQADAILAELAEIRALLEAQQGQPARPRARERAASLEVSIAEAPAMGRADAPVTVVEFTDYECPFCNRFHQLTFPELKRAFIDTGKVRYVVRDLPLSIHAGAVPAARAAHCAAEQERFWDMHAVLFRNAQVLDDEHMPEHAREAGLDESRFRECYESGRHENRVRDSAADALRLGISGTPTFIIGITAGGRTLVGTPLIGAQPYEAFAARIEQVLATAK